MKWHRWPEERPESSGLYLIWVRALGMAEVGFYDAPVKRFYGFSTQPIYWAEIEPPEGA